MIIFFEHGRLGNQLFQYAALKTFAGKEQICLIGFDNLRNTFASLEALFPLRNDSIWYKILQKLARNFLNKVLPATRLITTLHQVTTKNGIKIKTKKGLINRIKYCVTNYFQSDTAFTDNSISNLQINPSIKFYAQKKINTIRNLNSHIFFIHIRRGDYIKWPSREYPAVLPLEYYKKGINKIQSMYPDAFFIFCSDDIYYVQDIFSNMPNSFISNGTLSEDFALMSLCDGGVLSASSFAWWAAYFADCPSQNFIAPLYWAGYRKKKWYPGGIKTKKFEYIEA